MSERDLWVQRDNWLNGKQPALGVQETAKVDLLNEAKTVADKFNVVIKDQQMGNVDSKSPFYQSVTATFKTTSKWEEIVDFLYEMQAPERFVVFERASLKLDDADKSKMAGTFTIAKWYAPPAGPH
jgi:hypothetical protein